MKISAQEEYGLRCALQLARLGPGGALTIGEIADREGLSAAYVAKLMQLLRQAHLVRSVRGRSGGYTLDRACEEIQISQVLSALGGAVWEPAGCQRYPGGMDVCVHAGGCAVRSLWGAVDSVVDQLLRSITLADLLGGGIQAQLNLRTGVTPRIPAAHRRAAATRTGTEREP